MYLITKFLSENELVDRKVMFPIGFGIEFLIAFVPILHSKFSIKVSIEISYGVSLKACLLLVSTDD